MYRINDSAVIFVVNCLKSLSNEYLRSQRQIIALIIIVAEFQINFFFSSLQQWHDLQIEIPIE